MTEWILNDSIKTDAMTGNHLFKSNRVFHADLARAYAILAVIGIHVSAPLVNKWTAVSMQWWWIGNFFNSACRASVPLFVMISGMFLLNNRASEGIYRFFKNRFHKVFVPFAFWSVIYFLWVAFVNERHPSLFMFLTRFFEGSIYDHFWFIYMILGIYLITPVLRYFIQNASLAAEIYFIGLWIVLSSLLPMLQKLFDLRIGIPMVGVTGYVGYFVLGFLLNQISYSRSRFFFSMLLFLLAWMATSVGAFLSSPPSGFNLMFYEFLSPNVIGMSVGLFLIFKFSSHFAPKLFSPSFKQSIQYISFTSYPIYLMHVIILETLRYGSLGFKLNAFTFHPLIGIPVTLISIYVVCLMIVFLAGKIPILKILFS